MKKTLLLLIIVTVFAGTLPVAAHASRWISIDGGSPGNTHDFTILYSDPYRLLLKVDFHGMVGSVEATPEGRFSRITMDGCGVLYRPGSAELPVLRRFVEIPKGSDVRLEIVDEIVVDRTLEEVGLAGRVIPVQESAAKVPGATNPFAYSHEFYGRSGFQPAASAMIADSLSMRGRGLARLEIYPVRYNPESDVIRCTKSMVLEITNYGVAARAAGVQMERERSSSFNASLSKRVVNFGATEEVAVASMASVQTEGEGILFVGPASLLDGLEELIDWKRRSGNRVETLNTSLLAKVNTVIKDEIQSVYDTWTSPSLTAVILVGDLVDVPTFDGETSNHTADVYYGCLSGDDHFPDVWLGRLSVTDAQEAETVAERILHYEKAEFTNTDWIKNASFIATDDIGHYQVAEASHNYCIAAFMDPAGFVSDRLYAVSNHADTEDVRIALNEGRSIVTYSGHGSVTGWMGPSFEGTDVEALSLGERNPVVLSFACVTAAINVSKCYGETWLREKAVSFWGASDSSYWNEDDILQKTAFEMIFEEERPALGEMAVEALASVNDYYGGEGRSHYYYEVYHLLGDPTIRPWTAVPGDIDVEQTGIIAVGAETYTLSVSDGFNPIAGALVSLVKEDEGIQATAWTDSSGMAEILISPAPAFEGEMGIVITKHNFRPYEGACQVLDPVAPYLVSQGVLIDDSAGNGDGVPNPGEEVVMAITVENLGHDDAVDCTATITTSNDGITIVDGEADFPMIPGHDAATTLDPHFAWSSDAGVADGEKAGFVLSWSCSGGHGGETLFSARICANADDDGFSTCTGDCDDFDAGINPEAEEVCDGVDNNCDGEVDEGFADVDGDGFADCVDCDDTRVDVFPGAPELCDGLDNDCDGFAPAGEVDDDEDGWRVCAGDCDDEEIAVNPGIEEVLGNGIDDNCDGRIDEEGACFAATILE